jgi:hypothetical protein
MNAKVEKAISAITFVATQWEVMNVLAEKVM